MGEPYLGEIKIVPYNFAPVGWLDCNGALVPIAEYDALFALLGTTYGGDGQSTFALPNLQSRIPVHQGSTAGLPTYNLGQTGGAENVTLNTNTLAVHSHTFAGSNDAPNQNGPGGGYAATITDPKNYSYTTDAGSPVAMAGNGISITGGNQPHNNLMPVLCTRFIICTQGIYPPQN